MLLFLLVYSGDQHVTTIRVAWCVSYKRQGLLALREHMRSPLFFGGVHVPNHFSFLCCIFFFVGHRPLSNVPIVAGFR